MRAKVDLSSILSVGSPTTAAILNANNVKMVEAFERTLSLDGTAPNAMESELDLNGHSINHIHINED